MHRAIEETGVDVAQITRAYAIVREVFGLRDARGPTSRRSTTRCRPTAQHAGYQEIRRLIDRATRWLVDVRFPITDVAAEIERFGPAIAELSPAGHRPAPRRRARDLVRRRRPAGRAGPAAGAGAAHLAELLNAFLLLDVVEIANAAERTPREIAELHFALSEQFSVDEMLTAVTALPRDDRWSALARAALRHDVYAALSAITTAVLRATDPTMPARRAHRRRGSDANEERVERARSDRWPRRSSRDTVDLATLSVALRVMRGLPA